MLDLTAPPPCHGRSKEPPMIGLGVIGYGHWGPHVARHLAELDDATLVAVCDHHSERLARAERRHAGTRTSRDHRDLLADASIDAVAIATPAASHFELAMQALAAGKHVWVEKPLAATLEQARRLADEADRRNRVLVVDHTVVYSCGVRRLAELIEAGELGRIRHVDTVRMNLGLFRDVDVIADLGVHDFAILERLLNEPPVAVSATGRAHFDGVPADVANVSLHYPSGATAHVGLSWISPVRQRRMLVTGNRRMAVVDELDATEPLRIHDKAITRSDDPAHPGRPQVTCRSGDTWVPKVDVADALHVLGRHFVDCIANGRRPLTDAHMGARMVALVDAATRSMRAGGRPVDLDPPGARG